MGQSLVLSIAVRIRSGKIGGDTVLVVFVCLLFGVCNWTCRILEFCIASVGLGLGL